MREWARLDSNQQPRDYESPAQTTRSRRNPYPAHHLAMITKRSRRAAHQMRTTGRGWLVSLPVGTSSPSTYACRFWRLSMPQRPSERAKGSQDRHIVNCRKGGRARRASRRLRRLASGVGRRPPITLGFGTASMRQSDVCRGSQSEPVADAVPEGRSGVDYARSFAVWTKRNVYLSFL